MKVTKAKGLTRWDRSASAKEFGRRRAVWLEALRVRHEEQILWLFVLDAGWRQSHRASTTAPSMRSEQAKSCSGPLLWWLSFGPAN